MHNPNTLRLLLSVLPAKAGIPILQKSDRTPPVVYPVLRHGAGVARVQGFGGFKRKSYHHIAAALSALLAAPLAWSEEPVTLPVITVTASPTTDAGYVATQSATGTKTDTPLIETPQTINVITRDELTARAVQSTSQALAYTPGVNSQAFGTRSNGVDFLFLRGFDAPQYLDGTRLEFVRFGNQLKIEPYGMEHIEVLKGPASVLYGQSAPSGSSTS